MNKKILLMGSALCLAILAGCGAQGSDSNTKLDAETQAVEVVEAYEPSTAPTGVCGASDGSCGCGGGSAEAAPAEAQGCGGGGCGCGGGGGCGCGG